LKGACHKIVTRRPLLSFEFVSTHSKNRVIRNPRDSTVQCCAHRRSICYGFKKTERKAIEVSAQESWPWTARNRACPLHQVAGKSQSSCCIVAISLVSNPGIWRVVVGSCVYIYADSVFGLAILLLGLMSYLFMKLNQQPKLW